MTAGQTSSLEDYRRASDRKQADAARGIADVDRAVSRFHRGVIRPVHVTVEIAEQLGWPLCGCGAGGFRPGARVTWRGEAWHAECALIAARAAA